MRFPAAYNPLMLTYVFGLLYSAAILYARSCALRDPGSWFFDPSTAYEAECSDTRRRQAESFVATANSSSTPVDSTHQRTGHAPRMCVGVLSAARESRYIDTTIGSLVDGLTPNERQDIHLIVLIPHSDPTKHSAYREPWLGNLVNEILHYESTNSQFDRIVTLEREEAPFREKGLFDYLSLMRACLDRSDAPYIAIFEDDIVAMPDWYRRSLAGIAKAELGFPSDHRGTGGFLYLRLFYTEEFLGWNSEDWREHGLWSLLAVGISWLVLYCVYLWRPRSRYYLTPGGILTVCAVAVPLMIVLFFGTGRVTLFPLPAGVSVMNRYGCCSQGLVFPRLKAEDLASWFGKARVGFVDVLIEEYADRHADEERLALVPSVLQHVGRKSSKGDDGGRSPGSGLSAAETIWNFGFEKEGGDLGKF